MAASFGANVIALTRAGVSTPECANFPRDIEQTRLNRTA